MVVSPRQIDVNKELNNKNKSFLTFLNYFEAWAIGIGDEKERFEKFNRLVEGKHIVKIQTNKNPDIDNISRLMRNAWLTEQQLQIPSNNPEIIPVANHWVACQAYYSIYLMLRSFFLAIGEKVSRTHTNNLKQISEYILRRNSLFIYPLNVIYEDGVTPRFRNVPSGICPDVTINSLSNVDKSNPIDHIGKCLKTTKKDLLEKDCVRWKESNKKELNGKGILPKGKRNELSQQRAYISIFDFLFRMRVRTNYEEADTFLNTANENNNAILYYQSCRQITASILCNLEILITKKITKAKMKQIIGSFSSSSSDREKASISIRHKEILSRVK